MSLGVGHLRCCRSSPSTRPWECTALQEPQKNRVFLERRVSSGEIWKNGLFPPSYLHILLSSSFQFAISSCFRSCDILDHSSSQLVSGRVVFCMFVVSHTPFCILLGAWSSRSGIVSLQSIPQKAFRQSPEPNDRSACARRRWQCLFASASSRRLILRAWRMCLHSESTMFNDVVRGADVRSNHSCSPKIVRFLPLRILFSLFTFRVARGSSPAGLSPRLDRGRSKSLRDASANWYDSVPSCENSWCLNLLP